MGIRRIFEIQPLASWDIMAKARFLRPKPTHESLKTGRHRFCRATEATTRGRTHVAQELDDYASDAAPNPASLVSHGSADWAA